MGTEARGSPEGTARLEEPSAGLQLNKRCERSVSLEGQQRWEAPPAPPRLHAEDKQMLDETVKKTDRGKFITIQRNISLQEQLDPFVRPRFSNVVEEAESDRSIKMENAHHPEW